MKLTYGPHARVADVTDYSLGVLSQLADATGEETITISSTRRSPAEQARVMYENVMSHGGLGHGIEFNVRLYAAAGDQVIRVCESGLLAGKPAAEIIVDMAQRIIAIGPYKVSHHAADPVLDRMNVFDIAPSSLGNARAFVRAAEAEPRVSKVLAPPADPGVHLEIPQPA